MLDSVRVEMYGQQMQLNQVATINAPEPRVIIVTPFDKGQIKIVEKAIREAGPRARAVGAGRDHSRAAARDERAAPQGAREGRPQVRRGRAESPCVTRARTRAKTLKKLTGVSEDDVKHAEKDLQKLHDDYIHKIDELIKAKEAEIMEV